MHGSWISVGVFLGLRQLRRASKWTNALIVFVMTLTFLNLVMVTGILVGLIEGSSAAYRSQFSADVLISSLPTKTAIQQTHQVRRIVEGIPGVASFTERYITAGSVEANYKTRARRSDLPDSVQISIVGIDPVRENAVTDFSDLVVSGTYLAPGDEQGMLVGKLLLKNQAPDLPPIFPQLEKVDVGDTVRMTINGVTREMVIRGVLDSKVEAVTLRAYIDEGLFRKIANRQDFNVNEIAVKVNPPASPMSVKRALLASGVGRDALVQSWDETLGTFFQDIKTTFTMLGNVIGSVSLIVASITIFIVIFINAITRRKFIGILKGIGISGRAIAVSYIIQSMVYAAIGSSIGLCVLYFGVKPYIDAHPIDFPFSDGILVAPLGSTLTKIGLLFVSTLIAAYIPARIIIRKNTLDSILGR